MMTIVLVALSILATLYAIYLLVDRVLLAEEHPEMLLADDQLDEVDRLARRRALLMKELKDIDLDHETSKIDDEDYERLTRRFRREWLKIDKRLDEVAGLNRAYIDTVDAELERRLTTLGEDGKRARRADRSVCSDCAAANPLDARNCRQCGAPIQTSSARPVAQPA